MAVADATWEEYKEEGLRAMNEGQAGATNNRRDDDGAPSASCNDGRDGAASLTQQPRLRPRLPMMTGGDRC